MGKNKPLPKPKQMNNYTLPKKQKEARTQLVNDLFKVCSEVTEVSSMAQYDRIKEILQLLEKIQIIEKEVFFPSYKREEHFEPFLEWFTDNGGTIDGVGISSFDEGFGLICRKSLEVGDRVIGVPINIILSTDGARKSALGECAESDDMMSTMQNVFLALHLLNEYFDENSKWLPYMKILPSDLDLVLNYTADQIFKLKGSSVFERAMNLIKSIARQYGYFYTKFVLKNECPNATIGKYFTYNAYKWAVSCVMTRINILPMDDQSHYALSPLWDMANHTNAPISTDMDLQKNELTCFAAQDFEEGSQFYIFYGPRTNAEFFLNNGFVINPNPNDAVFFKLGIRREDPLYERKTQLLSLVEIQHSGNFSITNKKHPIPEDLLAYIRIANFDAGALKTYHENQTLLKRLTDTKLREGADRKPREFILARLRLLLGAYPTDNQPQEEKSVIEQRISELFTIEKKIYSDAINYIDPPAEKQRC